MTPSMRVTRYLPILCVALLAAACSTDDGPTAPEPPPGGNPTQPNPSGVLLEGDPTDAAVGAIVELPPSPVHPDDITDGLLTTRIDAVVNPASTVDEVNATLGDLEARIVSMDAGLPVVTLVVSTLADANAARGKADEIAASDAFLFASPSFSPKRLVPPVPRGARSSRVADAAHLDTIRMPLARNALRQATLSPTLIPVIVPDTYYDDTPHSDISAQTFVSGSGIFESDVEDGNWGFAACGLIGADTDATTFAGIHPHPEGLISIRSLMVTGLTWREIITDIADGVPPSGKFVLSTGLNYEFSFSERGKTWRAIDALVWRYVGNQDGLGDRFVHATAAGNFGDIAGDATHANYTSPFSVAEAFPDLFTLVEEDDDPDGALHFEILLSVMGEAEPPPLGNLLIVGSSEPSSYVRSDFSSPGEDVRVLGEDISSACVAIGEGCNGTMWTQSSTWNAAPQVAGLMAYLWNLSPARSPIDIVSIVDHAYRHGTLVGLVDAYAAVLALDPSLFDPRVRQAILDVAAGTDVFDPNGNQIFDHHDLKVFVDSFDDEDDIRFDLNGDGNVGGSGTAVFDLDANRTIETQTQTVEGADISFDEHGLTDLEVLCYYAYSDLYDGDTEAREILLAECAGSNAVVIIEERFSFCGVNAHAGSDRSNDWKRYTGLAPWTATASADTSTTVGDGAASSSSSGSASHHSELTVDAYQNLTSARGGGTLSGIATNVPDFPWNPGANGNGGYTFRVTFTIAEGNIPYEFSANYSMSPSGTIGFGRLEMQLDGAFDLAYDTFTDAGPGFVNREGTLTPGTYTLYVRGEGGGVSDQMEGGTASGTTSLTFEFVLSPP